MKDQFAADDVGHFGEAIVSGLRQRYSAATGMNGNHENCTISLFACAIDLRPFLFNRRVLSIFLSLHLFPLCCRSYD
jgi:hypothetical protein